MGQYSVETKNRFQLALNSDDDDESVDVFDILKQEEAKSEKKKAEAVLAKNSKNKNEKKDKPKKVPQKVENTNVTNVQNGISKGSGRINDNRNHGRQSNGQGRTGDNFEKPPASQDQQSGGFGGRGAKRGGFGGFRGGGNRGNHGGPRRFDRHSGSERTGVKAVEKREGFGSHNWGSAIDSQLDTSIGEDNQTNTERKEPDGEDTTINSGEANEASVEETVEPAEPEVKEMTLDEWKAAQASSRTKQQFNVRRPGEGEDPKQWKKTIALEPRKRAESTDSVEEHGEDIHEKAEDTRSTLNKLNIQIKFSSENNSRGGGGGRGRGRGFGGPRGGDRPPRGGFGGDRPPRGGFGGDRPPRGGFGGDRPPRSGFGGDRPPRSGFGGDRPPRSGFGGRSARRGGRGEYGSSQNDHHESYAPKMDEFEFPSLGSK